MRNFYHILIVTIIFSYSSAYTGETVNDIENKFETKLTDLPENFCEFVPGLYSGGEPTLTQFEELKRIGVTTVISVDGAAPKVAPVEELGMSYIHLPIGYDTVPNKVVASMMQLNSKNEIIYIHCHHGKHRGPAVAAIYTQLIDLATLEEVLEKMQTIGTSELYQGLWEAVRKLDPKEVEATPKMELVSSQAVDDLTSSMSKIDRLYDNVKDHLDLSSSAKFNQDELEHQSILLLEALKESARLDTHQWNTDKKYTQYAIDSNTFADQLVGEITTKRFDTASITLKNLKQSCTSCHQDFRN